MFAAADGAGCVPCGAGRRRRWQGRGETIAAPLQLGGPLRRKKGRSPFYSEWVGGQGFSKRATCPQRRYGKGRRENIAWGGGRRGGCSPSVSSGVAGVGGTASPAVISAGTDSVAATVDFTRLPAAGASTAMRRASSMVCVKADGMSGDAAF